MAFDFVHGPRTSTLSLEAISRVIERAGKEKKFMGLGRKMNTSAFGPGNYGPFAPSADTDPFAAARGRVDWSVGWAWGNTVTNSMGMTLRQGWQVVFDVVENGSSRSVTARGSGTASKSDVVRFIDLVFSEI